MLKVQFVLKKKEVCQLSVHQRVDILQAFLVNDTRRKIYCKNTLRSQRVNTHIFHLKAGEGDLLLIKEPALLKRCA